MTGLALIHVALLGVLMATDFKSRRIPQLWSLIALTVGVATALLSPYPLLNLVIGGLLAGLGLHGFTVGWWAGGDCFALAYLGLTFGAVVGQPLTLGVILLLAGLLSGRINWNDTVPIGACWGLSGLLTLLLPLAPLSELTAFRTGMLPMPPAALTSPASTPTFSPLSLPTPAPQLQICRTEAAWSVARVGLVDPARRRLQAKAAAATLQELTDRCPELDYFPSWSAALSRYARGDTTTLPLIQQFSRLNAQTNLTGGTAP
jgi:hypothetical protein